MTVIAFAGPSVTAADRRAFPQIEWRGPAEAGDLLRLPTGAPLTVCLVDGYFDHRPAVRHKEILLLLSEGTIVVGGASIGALRAAEMARFGMMGAGAIYRAYARGLLTGDDEVALAHGPEEWSWRPLSVPLVEVRATLCRAVRTNVLTTDEARLVRDAAAGIHYVDRTWDSVLAAAGPRSAAQLEAAMSEIEVPLKRLDAVACLSAAVAARPSPRRPELISTVFLHALMDECGLDPGHRLQARG